MEEKLINHSIKEKNFHLALSFDKENYTSIVVLMLTLFRTYEWVCF